MKSLKQCNSKESEDSLSSPRSVIEGYRMVEKEAKKSSKSRYSRSSGVAVNRTCSGTTATCSTEEYTEEDSEEVGHNHETVNEENWNEDVNGLVLDLGRCVEYICLLVPKWKGGGDDGSSQKWSNGSVDTDMTVDERLGNKLKREECQERVKQSITSFASSRVAAWQQRQQRARQHRNRNRQRSDEEEDPITQLYPCIERYLSEQQYHKIIPIFHTLLQHSLSESKLIAAMIYHSLSALHVWQSQFQTALTFALEALQIRRSSHHHSPAFIDTLCDIAVIHYALHNFSSAITMYKDALHILDNTPLKNSSNTSLYLSQIYNNMGCVYYELSQYSSSMHYFSKAFHHARNYMHHHSNAIPNHTDILLNISSIQCNTALVHFQNHSINEALSLLEEALMLQESVLPPQHTMISCTKANFQTMSSSSSSITATPQTPITASNTMISSFSITSSAPTSLTSPSLPQSNYHHQSHHFALLLDDTIHSISLGPLCKPFRPQEQVDRIKQSLLQNSSKSPPKIPMFDDVDTSEWEDVYLRTSYYLQNNNYEIALKLLHATLRKHESKYSHKHPIIAMHHHSIGIVYLFYSHQNDKALASFQTALRIRESCFGNDHPIVSQSLVKIAIVLMTTQHFQDSLSTFLLALSHRRRVLGYHHPHVARILNNIGCVHYHLRGHLAALEAYEEALEIQKLEKQKFPYNARTAFALCNIYTNLGFVKVKRREYDDAILALQEALTLQRQQQRVVSSLASTAAASTHDIGNDHYIDDTIVLDNLAYAMACANMHQHPDQQHMEPDNESLRNLIEVYKDMLQ